MTARPSLNLRSLLAAKSGVSLPQTIDSRQTEAGVWNARAGRCSVRIHIHTNYNHTVF
jgi:hypothetical protein